MVVSELRGLPPNEKKQAILRMSEFVLRETSANIRDSLYRRLLEIGTYISEESGEVGTDKLLDIIERKFFGIKLEKEAAEEYLKQLEKEGVIKAENGKYFLQEERKSQIETYSKKALSVLSSCETNFLESVKRKKGEDISVENIEKLTNCLYQFITQLVSRYVAATAKLIAKGTLTRISQSTGENLVDASVREISDVKLKEAAKTTLMEWMRSPSEEFIEYLFLMRQNFLCVEVLNLDPQCRAIEREEFSKKRLFLDTNLLLSLIVKGEFHTQTKKLVDNTRQLGCSVYVSRRTLEELNTVINRGKKLVETIRATPKQLSKASNFFVRTYGTTLLTARAISASEYMSQFSDVEKLLNEIGVEVFDDEHEEIKELPEYSELVKRVQNCFVRYRGRIKTVDVADHDAFNLLLVKTLRESETNPIMGPHAWFLSYDLTLSCADSLINRKFDFSERTSPVMIAEVWNEIILPFLVGIVTQKDLVEVLRSFISSEFTPISEGIDAEALVKLEIDWTEYDWLELEEIQEITKQRFVLRYISRREELTKTGDLEAIERLRSEFNVAFSRLIGQISNRKIEQVKTRLEEKEKETEGLKLSIKGLEETKHELRESLTSEQTLALRMRYITGTAGICSLIIGLVLVTLMKETASWQVTSAYIALLILGGVLLLMSIAPGQVSAILGLGPKK
jgi:predicted nucleic acid-binding protein